MAARFAAPFCALHCASGNRHHMHQQPAQAPFRPNNFMKSAQRAGVSGCVSRCIIGPDCPCKYAGFQFKKIFRAGHRAADALAPQPVVAALSAGVGQRVLRQKSSCLASCCLARLPLVLLAASLLCRRRVFVAGLKPATKRPYSLCGILIVPPPMNSRMTVSPGMIS